MLHATESGISSGRVGLWLVCAFTFTFVHLTVQLSSHFLNNHITQFHWIKRHHKLGNVSCCILLLFSSSIFTVVDFGKSRLSSHVMSGEPAPHITLKASSSGFPITSFTVDFLWILQPLAWQDQVRDGPLVFEGEGRGGGGLKMFSCQHLFYMRLLLQTIYFVFVFLQTLFFTCIQFISVFTASADNLFQMFPKPPHPPSKIRVCP